MLANNHVEASDATTMDVEIGRAENVVPRGLFLHIVVEV